MTQVANPSIVGSATQRYAYSSADSGRQTSLLMPESRISGRRDWTALLDQLRRWHAGASIRGDLEPGAAWRALDYARLAAADGTETPSRAGPTSSGGIAFEWERGTSLVHVEILDAWRAEYSEFSGRQLVSEADLIWDDEGQEFRAVDLWRA